MSTFWTSAIGLVLVGWTLREIFMDLFQPAGSGSLSSFLGRRLFRLFRRMPSMLSTTGPLCVVLVIFSWALLVAAGFAFLYWGRFPQGFTAVRDAGHGSVGRFWAVLYFSLTTLTTLASGDLSPTGTWIRLVAAMESLIGISLLTASITWIVLIYPALGRMRALSRRASTLIRAEEQTGLDLMSWNVQALLGDLAQSIIRTRVDLIHFPLIYYFHADTEGASLAKSLIQLTKLAERASDNHRSEPVRLAAAMLTIALADIAGVLAKFVERTESKDAKAVFAAVARDHLELPE